MGPGFLDTNFYESRNLLDQVSFDVCFKKKCRAQLWNGVNLVKLTGGNVQLTVVPTDFKLTLEN